MDNVDFINLAIDSDKELSIEKEYKPFEHEDFEEETFDYVEFDVDPVKAKEMLDNYNNSVT